MWKLKLINSPQVKKLIMSQKGSPNISAKVKYCLQIINYIINFFFFFSIGKDSICLVTSVSLALSTGPGLQSGSINICS